MFIINNVVFFDQDIFRYISVSNVISNVKFNV